MVLKRQTRARIARWVDTWTVIELVGVVLAGAGIWHRFGGDWACIFWGVLLIAAATLHTRPTHEVI